MTVDAITHGLWGHTAPAAPSTGRLSGDIEADVAIVGAGYTGLSAAIHLGEAGVRSVVLEANEIGFGGSGRNVGLVNAGLWLMPDAVEAALPPPFGVRLLDQLGDAPSLVFQMIDRYSIACEATRNGTLHCAVGAWGASEVTRRAEQWRRRGADVELLDAAAIERRTGSSAYQAALLDRRCGTIHPLAYARGLAKAAIDTGASIFTHTEVLSRERQGDRWELQTPEGRIKANVVLLAGNTYSCGALAAIKSELVRLPYFNFATSPLGKDMLASILPGGEGCWDTRRILSSFRLDASGRLIFGSVGSLRAYGHAIHEDWARRALARLFPQLGQISFHEQWFGFIGTTRDAMPRLHSFGPGCLSFSGYNGRGIAPGTSFGKDLADVVLGRKRPEELALPLTNLSPSRNRFIKEVSYTVGAQLAHAVLDRN